jgi:flavin-dependent dehydrogenase
VKTDVVIVGGGPAGSISAMRLIEQGVEPVIVEKEPFPRYHIGESMTGEAGGLLRGLGLEEQMLADPNPIKHGVNVYGSSQDAWFVPVMMRTPEGELADQNAWQVRRSTFDQMLLDEAEQRGAAVLPGKALGVEREDGVVRGLTVRPNEGGELKIKAEMTLDCSGQATFMSARNVTGPKYLGAYDKQIAVFSQVVGFERDPGNNGRGSMPGNTIIFYKSKYHWAWAIPIDDEVVSVGVVIPSQYFLDTGETKEAFLRRELHELHPELLRRLPEIELVEDVHVIPNYSFQVRGFAGPGFLCAGDSHRFVDPIFSFGLDAAFNEAGFAADTTVRYLEGEGRDSGELFREYIERCERRLDVFEDVIDGFWENPLAFAVVVHSRHRDSIIDTFAGRVHGTDDVPPALAAFRRVLRRERRYDDAEQYSVPIGSRFDAERAPLWNTVLDSVETTERWMREDFEPA